MSGMETVVELIALGVMVVVWVAWICAGGLDL